MPSCYDTAANPECERRPGASVLIILEGMRAAAAGQQSYLHTRRARRQVKSVDARGERPPGVQTFGHLGAGTCARTLPVKDLLDLVEREAEYLRLPDEVEACAGARRKSAG